MTTLRRFTPPTQDGTYAEISMTKAQFRELCRLGSHRDQDTVRFQPKPEVTFSYKE